MTYQSEYDRLQRVLEQINDECKIYMERMRRAVDVGDAAGAKAAQDQLGVLNARFSNVAAQQRGLKRDSP